MSLLLELAEHLLGDSHSMAATPKSPAPIIPLRPTARDPAPLLDDDAVVEAEELPEDAAEPFALLIAALAALVAELTMDEAELNAELLAAPVSVAALDTAAEATD